MSSCLTISYRDSLRGLDLSDGPATASPPVKVAADFDAIGYAMGRLGIKSRPRAGLRLDDELAFYKGRVRAETELEAEAFEAGRLASMEDAAPIPPPDWSDDRKGAFFEGYGEGDSIRIARSLDHIADLRRKADDLAGYQSLAGHDGW